LSLRHLPHRVSRKGQFRVDHIKRFKDGVSFIIPSFANADKKRPLWTAYCGILVTFVIDGERFRAFSISRTLLWSPRRKAMSYADAVGRVAEKLPTKTLVQAVIALLVLLSCLAFAEILIVSYAMYTGQGVTASLLWGQLEMKARPGLDEQKCRAVGGALGDLNTAIDKIAAVEYKQLADLQTEENARVVAWYKFRDADEPTQASDYNVTYVVPLHATIAARQENLKKSIDAVFVSVKTAIDACAAAPKASK
jgi:hypothetical protein